MGQLRTHDLSELMGLVLEDPKTSNAMRTHPGDPVTHRGWPGSYGIMISRYWGPNDRPMQCDVLWSRVSGEIRAQKDPIRPKSRVLRAKWTVEEEDPLLAGVPKFLKTKHTYVGTEEYSDMSTDEAMRMISSREDGVFNARFDGCGNVTLEKRTDRLPDYLKNEHGRITGLVYPHR